MRWRPLSLLLLAVCVPSFAPPARAQSCFLGLFNCCTSDVDCNDGDPCDGTETCEVNTGACVGGTAVVCAPDGNDCTSDACTPGVGCDYPPQAGPCNDGVFCNGIDSCDGGTCSHHAGNPCANGGECANVCQEGTGAGDGTCAAPDSQSCSDDGNGCTSDHCHEGACVHSPRDGADCDDGSACTSNDHCAQDTCVGTPKTCAASDECHVAGVCDPATGACNDPAQLDGTPCKTDGVACTADECQAGICTHAPADDRCDDGKCSQGACRPDDPGANGKGCVSVPVLEGEPCPDEGVCCTDDLCRAGTGLQVPLDSRCGDASDCASPVCAPDRGAKGTGCADTAPAGENGTCSEDASACTDDVCHGNACTHDRVAAYEECLPVQPTWERALGLARGAKALRSTVRAPAQAVSSPALTSVDDALGRVADDLDAAANTLAGRIAVPPAVNKHGDPITETVAAVRARGALASTTQTLATLKKALASARRPAVRALLADKGAPFASDGKILVRGVRQLRTELRALRKTELHFVR